MGHVNPAHACKARRACKTRQAKAQCRKDQHPSDNEMMNIWELDTYQVTSGLMKSSNFSERLTALYV